MAEFLCLTSVVTFVFYFSHYNEYPKDKNDHLEDCNECTCLGTYNDMYGLKQASSPVCSILVSRIAMFLQHCNCSAKHRSSLWRACPPPQECQILLNTFKCVFSEPININYHHFNPYTGNSNTGFNASFLTEFNHYHV